VRNDGTAPPYPQHGRRPCAERLPAPSIEVLRADIRADVAPSASIVHAAPTASKAVAPSLRDASGTKDIGGDTWTDYYGDGEYAGTDPGKSQL
jgi:hypothetical protein